MPFAVAVVAQRILAELRAAPSPDEHSPDAGVRSPGADGVAQGTVEQPSLVHVAGVRSAAEGVHRFARNSCVEPCAQVIADRSATSPCPSSLHGCNSRIAWLLPRSLCHSCRIGCCVPRAARCMWHVVRWAGCCMLHCVPFTPEPGRWRRRGDLARLIEDRPRPGHAKVHLWRTTGGRYACEIPAAVRKTGVAG